MKPFKIDKEVKVPPPSRPSKKTTPSRAAVTMQVLGVGDSFLIRDELEAIKAEKSMRDMNASARNRRSIRHYTARRMKSGLRIWRVK